MDEINTITLFFMLFLATEVLFLIVIVLVGILTVRYFSKGIKTWFLK